MKTLTLFAAAIFLTLSLQEASAVNKNVNQVPNGSKFSCQTCHASSVPALNSFGQEIKNGFYDASRNVIWNAQLAGLDSDADGVTNGEELLDPNGVWKTGDPNPGEPANVYNPGDGSSFPNTGVYDGYFAKYDYSISAISPNPAVFAAKFYVTMPRTGLFSAYVVSPNGGIIKKFSERALFEGVYPFEWDLRDEAGSPVASGSYSIIFNNAGRLTARQIIVAR
ncbi:MAG: hypothetical protein ACM3U1_10205 [Chloroflexota bacterium]